MLGAAADDLYEMKDFRPALAAAQKLIERYPATDLPIRRSAWTVVAHASFDLTEYPQAEVAYTRVLELTPQRRREARGARRQSCRLDLQAGRAGEPRAGLSRGRKSLPAHQAGRADVEDSRRGGVRRGRSAHPARGLGCGGRGARCISAHVPGARAAARGDEADRVRLSPERASGARGRRVRAHRDGGRQARAARRGAARSPAICTSNRRTRERALAVYLTLCRGVSATARSWRSRRASRSPTSTRRRMTTRAITKQLQQIVSIDAAAGGERTDRTTHPGGALGARAGRELLSAAVRSGEAGAAVREQPAGETARMDAAMKSLGGSRRLPGRRGDRRRHLLHGGGVLRLQPLAARIGAPDRSAGRAIGRNTSSRSRKNAFPFEEKAIDVHEKNLELIRAGIYNAWIEKSLAKLAQLMPARYAKTRNEQRLPRFDRSLCVPRAVRARCRTARRWREGDARRCARARYCIGAGCRRCTSVTAAAVTAAGVVQCDRALT